LKIRIITQFMFLYSPASFSYVVTMEALSQRKFVPKTFLKTSMIYVSWTKLSTKHKAWQRIL